MRKSDRNETFDGAAKGVDGCKPVWPAPVNTAFKILNHLGLRISLLSPLGQFVAIGLTFVGISGGKNRSEGGRNLSKRGSRGGDGIIYGSSSRSVPGSVGFGAGSLGLRDKFLVDAV